MCNGREEVVVRVGGGSPNVEANVGLGQNLLCRPPRPPAGRANQPRGNTIASSETDSERAGWLLRLPSAWRMRDPQSPHQPAARNKWPIIFYNGEPEPSAPSQHIPPLYFERYSVGSLSIDDRRRRTVVTPDER